MANDIKTAVGDDGQWFDRRSPPDGQEKQQRRWTQRGAHLLLPVRTQVLNDDLRHTSERWYPGLKTDIAPTQEAAA